MEQRMATLAEVTVESTSRGALYRMSLSCPTVIIEKRF